MCILIFISEREVAVRLFGSLGSRSGKRQRSMSEPHVTYRPLSRQPLPPPLQGWVHGCMCMCTWEKAIILLVTSHEWENVEKLILPIYYIYHTTPSSSPSISLSSNFLSWSLTCICSGASGQRLPSRQLASGSGPRGAKHPPSKPWPAGLWHHLPVRDPPPQVYHRGALFGDVRGDASHYNVHPEWPDYFNTSLNSDAVHWESNCSLIIHNRFVDQAVNSYIAIEHM